MVWYQQINRTLSGEKTLCLISLLSFTLNLSLIFFWDSLTPARRLEAFAWWSDLMVDHAETFLCLYSADMDAALEVQPPDSWDSFPLFQLLNDFLRMDCESPTTRPPTPKPTRPHSSAAPSVRRHTTDRYCKVEPNL